MTKSLLVSEIFPPQNGGSGRWFWELYHRLPREDFMLAVGKQPGDSAFDQSHDLNLLRLNLSSAAWGIKSWQGLRFYIKTILTLRKIIKQNEITELHCGRCLPEGILGLAMRYLCNIPYICFIHGEDVEAASSSRELSWLVAKSLQHADTLICNSHNTAKIINQKWHIPAAKISVLHPGVDTTNFIPANACDEIKKQLDWHSKKVILTVGRLQKRKGHDMVIKALPTICKRIPNVLFAIIGEGEEKQSLQALCQQLDVDQYVRFMSEISDKQMIQAYQQCDLFILANRTEGKDIEGFGMVLIEAQSCGKYVIAGDSGGTKDTMQQHITGEIIDCTSLQAISETLIHRLSSDSIDSDIPRNFVVNNFDWRIHVQKFEVILKRRATYSQRLVPDEK